MKALTEPKASPSARGKNRSRRGETSGAFKLAAPRMTRRVVARTAFFHAVDFLWDTLHWLHLWDNNDYAHTEVCSDELGYSEEEHLSLHL